MVREAVSGKIRLDNKNKQDPFHIKGCPAYFLWELQLALALDNVDHLVSGL